MAFSVLPDAEALQRLQTLDDVFTFVEWDDPDARQAFLQHLGFPRSIRTIASM